MTKIGNISTIVVSSVCLALWITVTVYYGTWDTSETNWDLLQVSTCPINYKALTKADRGHAPIATTITMI